MLKIAVCLDGGLAEENQSMNDKIFEGEWGG